MLDRRLLLSGLAIVVLGGGFLASRWLAAPPAPVATAPTPLPACPPAQRVAPPSPATAGGLDERSLGLADAPVTAIEYFSLTCSHCG
ncbi:MAG: DsbA family protein, partial [Roseomonas sp.]|nr:DsbA family protein [Roseomonas sp.]